MAGEKFSFLKLLLVGPQVFKEAIAHMDDLSLEFAVEVIKGLIGDMKILFQMIEKLKRIIKGVLSISHKIEAKEAFTKNIELICEVLNCDRASIFLHDRMKNTLWTVSAKGGRKIEIPSYAGIAGDVFTHGEGVNIEDVYLDKRFNRGIDAATNYRTRSMLCVPIVDGDRELIGVCQAINSKHGVFSTDDEKLFGYLSKEAGITLINAIEYKEKDISHELLKRAVNVLIRA